MLALETLYEVAGLPGFDLPDDLRTLYGGPVGFARPCLYANFVSTLDGVVAIESEPHSNRVIRGGSEADRFVMALLRACADAVLVGAGTFRGSRREQWTAEYAYPPAAASFAALRRRLGLAPAPVVAIMTNSGSIDPKHPALEPGALVLTTETGAARLRGRLPASAALEIVGPAAVNARAAVDALRARGHRLVLSESGPHAFGALLRAGLVDELFLTLSPLVAGRADRPGRLGLVGSVELLPGTVIRGRLESVRRHDAHLFLRYAMERRAAT